jgi:hypothetical protein
MPEPPPAEPALTVVDATRSSSAGLPSVERRARRSGLIALTVLGQRESDGEVLLSDPPDEERDAKTLYIAAHAS